MKILVISDTHGSIAKVEEIAKRLTGIDLLVHLGDYSEDGWTLSQRLGIDVITVKGNMDGEYAKKYEFFDVECGKILITHGHLCGVNHSYNNLLYACEEEGCVAAFFGHTHVPCNEEIEGIRLLNPGSISRPRDGSEGSYAIVHTDEEGIECSVIYYRKEGELPKKKPQGGYLRALLNYSDRF
ncbi:MAG: metallophosphoesterase [Anaerovoracaceae bacterium]